MSENTSPSQNVSRRDFIKITWAFLGGAVALETAGVLFAYLQPRLTAGEFGSVITAGLVDDFPPNSVTHITNGCYRLHPVEWNIGESVGTLVAFCHEKKRLPREVRAKPDLLEAYQSQLTRAGVPLTWPKEATPR